MDLNDALSGGGSWPAQGGGSWPAQGGGSWPTQGGGSWPAQGGGSWPAQGGGSWPNQPGNSNSGGWPCPSSAPTAPHNVTMPFSLPSGVYDKLCITIAGKAKPNAHMFAVDLCAGNDLAFHINPRFNEQGRKVVVRNSRVSNKWGREERELSSFPFNQGKDFVMKILCTSGGFMVAVNEAHLLEFKHRITDLRSINKLNIHGDVTVSGLNMCNV